MISILWRVLLFQEIIPKIQKIYIENSINIYFKYNLTQICKIFEGNRKKEYYILFKNTAKK